MDDVTGTTTLPPGDADALLLALAGPDARLREDQREAIVCLATQRRKVLLVQRTGWGKSAVYWIATALRRREGAGPTLVVSPLLALMRDQVAAAATLGLRATTINSTNADAWDEITAALDRDEVDVLLISPERLNAPSFRPHLDALADRVGLLVIDEAHCISDWGHEFRPDYRRVAHLLERLAEGTPVLACTATANERVVGDVAAQIGTDTITLRGPLGRDSLRAAVVRTTDAETRLAWLDGFVRRHAAEHGRAGIIYTLTVADTTVIAEFLAAQGRAVVAYNSNVETDDRQAIEDDLKANRLDAVVATSALGMGYDKPDLPFVVHVGAPSSPISYYQQIGRAGRAIDTADVVLMPTAKDERIWEHFDLAGIPREDEVTQVLANLQTDAPTSVPSLERLCNLRPTRMQLLLRILDVEGVVDHVRGGYVRTAQAWHHDAERYDRLRAQRRLEHAAMRELLDPNFAGCLMRQLTRQLDDPDTTPCGRCNGCSGWTPDVDIDPAALDAARGYLRGRDVELPERRRWPSGLGKVKGNIAADHRPAVGRSLGDNGDSGWGTVVDELLGLSADEEFDARYEELVEQVVDGLVQVLARWDWGRRPTAIVPVPSRTHTRLIGDVAARLGALGKLPVVEAIVRVAQTPPMRAMDNSAHQAANALDAYGFDADAALPDGAVLLLDTARDSGWTTTVCSYLLRSQRPFPVLPLTLTTSRS